MGFVRSTYLSHFINKNTPLYGGEKAVLVKKRSQISKGASSNTMCLKLPNHCGTHIDFPNHFSDNGKTINDYSPKFWIFNHVFIINYKAKPDEIICEFAFEGMDIPSETDFLIINSGFGKFRKEEKYWDRNPGLSPELAKYIRDKCPKIKAVGFDFISVSSYQNRIVGREAHQEFLIINDILLIEDMKLDNLHNKTIKSIIALPLLIDKSDGAPITIVAEYI